MGSSPWIIRKMCGFSLNGLLVRCFVPGLNSFPPPRSGVRPGRDLVQDGTRIDKGCDIVILNVVLIS